MAKELTVQEAKTMEVALPNDDSRIDTTEVLEGIELKKTKLGKFESPMISGLSFAELDVVIVGGQLDYTMWGDEEKCPDHRAKFFFEAKSKDEAVKAYAQIDEAEGLSEKGYTFAKDVKEGYVLFFVDAKTNAPYYIKMSKSGKKEFLNYSQGIKYGLLGNTNKQLSKVVTKLSAQEMKGGSFTWIAEKFEFVKDIETK